MVLASVPGTEIGSSATAAGGNEQHDDLRSLAIRNLCLSVSVMGLVEATTGCLDGASRLLERWWHVQQLKQSQGGGQSGTNLKEQVQQTSAGT